MAKRGVAKAIESPEVLWQHFLKYMAETKKKPIKVKDWVGGAGKQVMREKEKPLTNEGFSNYLFENEILVDVKDYFSNREGRYDTFVPICSRIREKIRQDQIEGGMAGIYNPSITQRLNGLSDSQKTEQSGTLKIVYEDLNANKVK